MLGYTGAQIIEDACVRVPIARDLVDEDGVIRDEQIRARLHAALDAIVSQLRVAAV